jgi:hypothetical protein
VTNDAPSVQIVANPVARALICAKARGWVGTPFKHLGRDRKGVDCVGLVLGVAQDLGLDKRYGLPNLSYGLAPNPAYVIEQTAKWLVPTGRKLEDLIPGDIATWWGVDPGTPRHLAIIGWDAMCKRRTMVHAFAKHRKVIEHSFDKFWPQRFVAGYEYPDTEPTWSP